MAEVAEDLEDTLKSSIEAKATTQAPNDSINDAENLKDPVEAERESSTMKSTDESSKPASNGKRNAFSELMAPKAKQAKPEQPHPDGQDSARSSRPNDPRAGLLPYILHPEEFPASTVLRVTEHTVLIRDMFPKSTIHLLLLPRMQYSSKHLLDPRAALSHDPAFLSMMRREASTATALAANELSRLLSPGSASSQARHAALDPANPNPPTTLPEGRDFSSEVRAGVHAHPSMAHLHVHILSVDMHSDRLKHRKHYNSFNTDFFIPLHDFPLPPDDPRWRTSVQNENLRRDFKCWRCGAGFGNKFKALKAHLDDEFEAWKKV